MRVQGVLMTEFAVRVFSKQSISGQVLSCVPKRSFLTIITFMPSILVPWPV